jgi:hypothetical protein
MAIPQKHITDIVAEEDFRERFWQLVKKSGGCWLWEGQVHTNGYGMFSIGGDWYFAHRLAFELCVGDIPSKLMILHLCDNRLCCNPDHLLPGTASENMRDAAKKGRMGRGKRYSEEEIEAMRNLYATGNYTQHSLATMFKTDQAHISRIVNKIRYK